MLMQRRKAICQNDNVLGKPLALLWCWCETISAVEIVGKISNTSMTCAQVITHEMSDAVNFIEIKIATR